MKKSYWILFLLAILSPFFVGISFLLKYKEIVHYEKFAYLSLAFLLLLVVLAIKELVSIFKDLK